MKPKSHKLLPIAFVTLMIVAITGNACAQRRGKMRKINTTEKKDAATQQSKINKNASITGFVNPDQWEGDARAGVTFNNAQIIQYSECYLAYTALKDGFDQATDVLSAHYAATPWREKKNPKRSLWTSENVDKDKEITALELEIQENITQLQARVKATVNALANTIRYQDISWVIAPQWYKDPDINEVLVAFG